MPQRKTGKTLWFCKGCKLYGLFGEVLYGDPDSVLKNNPDRKIEIIQDHHNRTIISQLEYVDIRKSCKGSKENLDYITIKSASEMQAQEINQIMLILFEYSSADALVREDNHRRILDFIDQES